MRTNPSNGFTLIEIMIVLAIISILAAIASTEFQGYVVRTADKAAQSDVRNLLILATGSARD